MDANHWAIFFSGRWSQILTLKNSGQRLAAIKLIRAHAGLTFKEADAWVRS